MTTSGDNQGPICTACGQPIHRVIEGPWVHDQPHDAVAPPMHAALPSSDAPGPSRKSAGIRAAWAAEKAESPEQHTSDAVDKAREADAREQAAEFTAQAEKIRENRLRRMAERQGLQLMKSRRRDPRAIDYGTYMLTNPSTNTLALWGNPDGYGLTLDEIEAALTAERHEKP